MLVCPKCFQNKTLASQIEGDGVVGNCPNCGAEVVPVIDASELRDYFEPLARLYEVAEPGTHYALDDETGEKMLGDEGEFLGDLLQNDWSIFTDGMDQETISAILKDAWPEYDSSSLYASEDLFYSSPDDDFQSLARHLMHKRRFFLDADELRPVDLDTILGRFLEDFVEVSALQAWYRARKHVRCIGEDGPTPYPPSEMGATPPERVVRAGRANPAGISYLYLASDLQTAVAEVRSESGDVVSVAKFEAPDGLGLVNLVPDMTALDPFACSDLRGEIERRSLLREFGMWLSRHVREEDHEIDYVVTQYLTEYILAQGYDGIKFKSSLTKGMNLVLFDPSKARLIEVSQYRIPNVEITYGIEKVRP